MRLSAEREGASPALGFVTGDRRHGANTTFKSAGNARTTIQAGALPFYAYDVLFDADSGTIAVRPNLKAFQAVAPLRD